MRTAEMRLELRNEIMKTYPYAPVRMELRNDTTGTAIRYLNTHARISTIHVRSYVYTYSYFARSKRSVIKLRRCLCLTPRYAVSYLFTYRVRIHLEEGPLSVRSYMTIDPEELAW